MMSTVQESQQQQSPPSSIPTDQLAMLNISSAVVHHHSTGNAVLSDQRHTCGSIKKPPNHEITAPEKTTTVYDGATTRNPKRNFEGFIKLPLQESPAKQLLPPPPPPPPLYRTFSDPTGGSASSSSYKRYATQEMATPSPSPSPAKKPPLPPCLRRTLSDPTNLSPTVQQDSPATTMRLKRMKDGMREMSQWFNHMIHQEDAVSEEINNLKRLKRMKEGMREMSQWLNHMIPQEDADAVSEENNNLKEENEKETPSSSAACDCEEAVWVERRGDCLVLHFKCPCAKGYEILLLGNNCYYKLD